jgi:hypothetical protein
MLNGGEARRNERGVGHRQAEEEEKSLKERGYKGADGGDGGRAG